MFYSEWVLYKFKVEKASQYDIRIRVAANAHGRKVKLIINPDDPHQTPFGKDLVVPADGWDHFNDLVWENIHLQSGHYGLQVYFVTGKVNFCSAAVYASRRNPAPKPTPKPTPSPIKKPTL
jgi:hypothetical protein